MTLTDQRATKRVSKSLLACAGVLFALTSAARADDDLPLPTSAWILSGLYSYHFDRNAGYRNDNYGVGVKIGFTDDTSVLAGVFRNSDNATSHYVGVLWQPLALGPVRLGAAAGGFNGYPYERDGGWFLAAIPMATVAYERVALNFTAVPNYKNKLHGALSVQAALKVW